MINHVSFQGRFVKDLKLYHSSTTNKPWVKFTLAWSEKTKNNVENSCFLNCVAFNKVAENAAKYFKKGQMAVIEGKLITNNYTDQDGQKKYTTDLIAEKIHFCDVKKPYDEEDEDDVVTAFD